MAKKQPKILSPKQELKKTLGLLSDEELFFYYYLTELKENTSVLYAFNFNCHSINLSDAVQYPYITHKVKNKKIITSIQPKTVLNEHVYTPDFEIMWNRKDKLIDRFVSASTLDGSSLTPLKKEKPFTCLNMNYYSCIEVKPIFDHQGMQRLFSINQKWVYSKHGIYVQKIVPQNLFEATFTPKEVINDPDMIYKVGKNIGQTKIKWKIRTLEEFINEN